MSERERINVFFDRVNKVETLAPTVTTSSEVKVIFSYNINDIKKITAGVLASSKIANDAIGSYTGNKARQSNINSMIALSTLIYGAFKNPTIALATASSFLIKKSIDNTIEIKNAEQQNRYRTSYLGNMTTSGGRWRGGK